MLSKIQLLLVLIIVISATAVVTVRHQSRLEFVRLQASINQSDALQSEWGRLMLERATLTRQNNVAEAAKSQLAMAVPLPDQIITLDLTAGKDK